jgi:DNA-directed RNA polymerase specialized sigma24 family protein
VRGMVRSDADTEDVTQDALLTVLTSLNASS